MSSEKFIHKFQSSVNPKQVIESSNNKITNLNVRRFQKISLLNR